MYYPKLATGSPETRWIPGYQVAGPSGGEVTIALDDAAQDECPISVMGRMPDTRVLAAELISMQNLKEFAQAVPFGPNSNSWPAKWHDYVCLADAHEGLIEFEKEKMRNRLRGQNAG